MVAYLILDLLDVVRRHVAIASNVCEIRSKASVGLLETLVASLDSQLFLHIEFEPGLVEPVVFIH